MWPLCACDGSKQLLKADLVIKYSLWNITADLDYEYISSSYTIASRDDATMWLCVTRRIKSARTLAKSDQNLRYQQEIKSLPTGRTVKIFQTKWKTRFASNLLGFVITWLICNQEAWFVPFYVTNLGKRFSC